MTSTDRHLIESDNFDTIYRDLLRALSYDPQYECAPRNQKIKENLAVTLVLTDPRARLLSCKKRNTNYGFAVGEFLWYWQGKNDLETMVYYNKRMNAYSNDGKTLNSAYGHRLRKLPQTIEYAINGELQVATMTQWEVAKKTLLQDSDSRRCILHINRQVDQLVAVTEGSKDVPCTLSLQFFIRDGKLDLHVHMRSNDVMWGLTYDLFSFTLFQECMLLDLQKEEKFRDLKLGKYYHTAGSLHLYEPHFQQAEDIVKEYGTGGVDIQPPQKPLVDLQNIDIVCRAEESLRTGKMQDVFTGAFDLPVQWMIEQLVNHRNKRDAEKR